MPAVTAEDFADLVAATLKDLGRMNFEQIAQNLQDYIVFTKWFKKNKVSFDSGIGIQKTLMNRLTGAAAHVGFMAEDQVDISDVVDQLSVPWRHANTHWGYFFQESLMNRGKSMIFDVVKPRRADAMISLVEELENKAWASPAVDNKTEPYGIPYWIVKNSTTGFTGGAPSGHTTVGGVSLTDSPTFKNYSAQYTTSGKTDLIRKLRTAHRKCQFKSPIPGSDYSANVARYSMYVNETTYSEWEEVGEAQNENLGRDIAPIGGGNYGISFRGNLISWVPKLDADTTNPVYGVDHSTFFPVCLKGDYLRESKPKEAPNQHNVYQVFVDLTYNFICLNRRRNWVMYK